MKRDLENHATSFMLNQMPAKVGMRKHGQKALAVPHDEFLQLHDTETFAPVNPKAITQKQKRKSLNALPALKEKRCGKLKGRACVGGRKQRARKSKVESASPAVNADSVTLTSLVDACEGRDVAVADAPGACLNANVDEFTLLKMVDEQVDVMCRTNEKCTKCVSTEKEKKVLFLMLSKALRQCAQSALL